MDNEMTNSGFEKDRKKRELRTVPWGCVLTIDSVCHFFVPEDGLSRMDAKWNMYNLRRK